MNGQRFSDQSKQSGSEMNCLVPADRYIHPNQFLSKKNMNSAKRDSQSVNNRGIRMITTEILNKTLVAITRTQGSSEESISITK